jgi:hypothetical protein
MSHENKSVVKTWSRSPTALASIAASIAIVAIAERDLHSRPDSEIRGNKLLWRLASLNAVGAIAYLCKGRYKPADN